MMTPDDDGMPEPMHAVDPGNVTKGRRRVRNQLLGAALLGGLSVGVSVMSCVGQSFSLRQARALEAIQHALELRCSTVPSPAPEVSR